MNTMPDSSTANQFDVPADFPRTERLAAVPGFQTKFVATKYEGKYYMVGCTPPEVWARWDNCEDLAKQLAVKSLESKAGKRSHMSEVAILEQYHTRLKTMGWVSDAEADWVIRRVAVMLGWQVPEATLDPL